MDAIEFARPNYFLFLLLVPLLLAWVLWRDRDRRNAVIYSSLGMISSVPGRGRTLLRYLPLLFRLMAVVFITVALARPQSFTSSSSSTTEGIDIMLSLDVSGSMLARDFKPDRIEAAKSIGMKFISGRPTDRMGLVIFAAEAFTMCPLTIDHATLLNQFQAVQMDILEDGTAIGSGLAMAVNRLVHSDAVSRVVILLTDGVNNSGEVAPYTAAEIAKAYGIRVYVIGIGTRGLAPYPVSTPFGVRYQDVEVQIDEPLMQQIADLTGGEYFRATDNKALEEIYDRIDQLERSKIHVDEHLHRHEEYAIWALFGLLCLVVDFLLRHVVLRILP